MLTDPRRDYGRNPYPGYDGRAVDGPLDGARLERVAECVGSVVGCVVRGTGYGWDDGDGGTR